MFKDVTNYFANFSTPTNTCRTVFLYLTLAILIAAIILKLTVPKERKPLANKILLGVVIAYAAATVITFAICAFKDDSMVKLTFFPLLTFALCCIIGATLLAVKPVRALKIAVFWVIAASFIAAVICMMIYYAVGDAAEHNWIDKSDVSDLGLYLSAAALLIGVVLLAFFADKSQRPFDSHAISFAAICVALSFALSYVRIFKMPMGGSITFASTLPIMLFSYMFGSRKGVVAGLIYGTLQAVQDPWILHPAQFILDYGVAFAGIGVAGCIKDFNLFKGNARAQFALGAAIGGAIRFLAHYFSGVFAFGSFGLSYAEEYGISALSSPWIYSLVYQSLYVIPEVIIVIIAGVILFSSRSFVRQTEKYSKAAKKQAAAGESAEA